MTATFSRTQQSSYNNRYRAKSDAYRSAEITSTSKVNDAWKASTKESNGGFKLIWRYCKKEGHTERVCRFKQVAENKRQSQANNATLEAKSNLKSKEYIEFGWNTRRWQYFASIPCHCRRDKNWTWYMVPRHWSYTSPHISEGMVKFLSDSVQSTISYFWRQRIENSNR